MSNPRLSPSLSEFQYQAAWRNCKWQLDWLKQSVMTSSCTYSADIDDRYSESGNKHNTSTPHSTHTPTIGPDSLPSETLLVTPKKQSHFHMCAYNCLKSVNDGDQATFWKNLKKSRLELVQAIGITSLESTKSVYPALAKLQFLGEIENAWHLRWGSPSNRGEDGKTPGSVGGDVDMKDLGFDIVTGGTQSLPPLSAYYHFSHSQSRSLTQRHSTI